jgi:CheY-like chemotaxis protein
MTMREREGSARARRGSVAAVAPTTAADATRRRPILVVDDDQQVLGVVVRSLRVRGHEVRGVGSGREALLTIYGGGPAPALLLTDVDMPGMTGIELAARVAADRPGVAIVLMSGSDSVVQMARERPELVRGVITKPFEIDHLLTVVEGIVGAGSRAETRSG